MNNLKQIGMGFFMYVDDYDGWLPPAKCNTVLYPKNGRWYGLLQCDYVKNSNVFVKCGSAKGRRLKEDGRFDRYRVAYGINGRLFHTTWSTSTEDRYIKMIRISNPSNIILAGDSQSALIPDCNSWNTTPQGYAYVIHCAGSVDNNSWPHFRHNGQANFVFVDGHVESMDRTEALRQEGSTYVHWEVGDIYVQH